MRLSVSICVHLWFPFLSVRMKKRTILRLASLDRPLDFRGSLRFRVYLRFLQAKTNSPIAPANSRLSVPGSGTTWTPPPLPLRTT